jgi:hypothetical protein
VGRWLSAQGVGDPPPEHGVGDERDVAPFGAGDFLGLELTNIRTGAEEEPEVDVPVFGFPLGRIGGDGMNVDVQRAGAAASTASAEMPVSSVSSRNAAARSVVSSGSMWPPGKSHCESARCWTTRTWP